MEWSVASLLAKGQPDWQSDEQGAETLGVQDQQSAKKCVKLLEFLRVPSQKACVAYCGNLGSMRNHQINVSGFVDQKSETQNNTNPVTKGICNVRN